MQGTEQPEFGQGKGPPNGKWHDQVWLLTQFIRDNPHISEVDSALKFVFLTVDTRDGTYRILDHKGDQIDPRHLVAAAKTFRGRARDRG